MVKVDLSFEGECRIWDYSASHSRLVVLHLDGGGRVFAVMFAGVTRIELSTHFRMSSPIVRPAKFNQLKFFPQPLVDGSLVVSDAVYESRPQVWGDDLDFFHTEYEWSELVRR